MRPRNIPNDPGRRAAIIASAISLIEEEGVGAVTARAVAARATIPLGSVSYHFASVKMILLESSRSIVERRTESLAVWRKSVTAETVIDRLAELIHAQVTVGRRFTVAAYELYILGLRDVEFRDISRTSIPALQGCLAEFVPLHTAAHLAATADGLQLESLFEPDVPTVDDLRHILAVRGQASVD
jgi:TetR/AcrR family transcriptional regulator, regulator of biofilm formation and stress response